MTRPLRRFAAATRLLLALCAGNAALAQKPGGILKMYSPDSPASMSIHEEATVFAEGPMMGVFNNLVIFDQHVPQNSLQPIVPDLATGWSWNEEGTQLTFPLRQGITWHDGKPYTAKDVACNFDMLTGKAREKVRVKPQTSTLGYVSAKCAMTCQNSPTVPPLKDVKSQMPRALCDMGPVGLNRALLVNRDKPPVDNADLRQAMALSLDRQAFIDILTEGEGDIGGGV